MREILFRGKTTKKELPIREFNEIWVYGDLIKSNGKYYIHPQANQVKVESEIGKLICMHEVIPETVGQFTGLTDKNGNKIFEGDIAIVGRIRYIVAFKGAEWKFSHISGQPYCYPFFASHAKDSEVIGNIHDNIELLEKDNVQVDLPSR